MLIKCSVQFLHSSSSLKVCDVESGTLSENLWHQTLVCSVVVTISDVKLVFMCRPPGQTLKQLIHYLNPAGYPPLIYTTVRVSLSGRPLIAGSGSDSSNLDYTRTLTVRKAAQTALVNLEELFMLATSSQTRSFAHPGTGCNVIAHLILNLVQQPACCLTCWLFVRQNKRRRS